MMGRYFTSNGISFKFRGEEYRVSRVLKGVDRQISDYIGIPGKIINIEEDEIWVKTKDNAIVFKTITRSDGSIVDPRGVFHIGNQLD